MKYNSDIENSVKPSTNFLYIKQFKKNIRNLISQILVYPLDYLHIHHADLFQKIIQFKRSIFSNYKYIVNKNAVPEWVKTELIKLSKIEPNLKNFKNPQIRKKRPRNRLNHAITPQMQTLIRERSSKVYILDGLEDDWETLKALNYLHYPDTNIFVVTTKKGKNRWKKFLPDESILIDIGNSNLFFEEKLKLLHRLILESDVEYLHLFGSKLALEMIARYHGTIKNTKVFACFFLSEFIYNEDEVLWKYRNYAELLEFFTCIATDTKIVKGYLLGVYGLPDRLVQHHRMPYTSKHLPEFFDVEESSIRERSEDKQFQKIIDLLILKMKSKRNYNKIDEKMSNIVRTDETVKKAGQANSDEENGIQPIDEKYCWENFTEQAKQFYSR